MLNQPPPADIYLDTTIVVAAILAGTHLSAESLAFCAHLASHNCRIYFSQILRLEYSEAIRRLAQRRQLPEDIQKRFGLDQWDTNFMVRRRWLDFGVNEFRRFIRQFKEVVELPFGPGTWKRSVAIMALYGLRSHDAIHVATALQAKLRDVVTLDGDFQRVTDLNIWLIRGPQS